MKNFGLSLAVTLVCLGLAAWWGYFTPDGILKILFLTSILALLEVSLSFDNAVVNAAVLKTMTPKWQKLFLTVGMIVAVFGMRLLFPILIVAIASGLDLLAVADIALNDSELYEKHLIDSHVAIASFGGMFLLLVFLNFIFDSGKEIHWLGKLEEKLAYLGKIESISIIIALMTLFALQMFLPLSEKDTLMLLVSGISGVILYVIVDSLDSIIELGESGDAVVKTAKRSGVIGFIYLEVLDASFSFDGVIGAFAISRDIVVIMLGLTIGAMFVRSLTVYLVKKGTLDEYVFLEHGAHYAIGALAVIMLVSINKDLHIPEVVTGTIGVVFIAIAVLSSILYKKGKAKAGSE